MVVGEGVICGRILLFPVWAVFVLRLCVHKMEFVKIVLNMRIDLIDDLFGHLLQFDDSVGPRNPIFCAIGYDRLAKTGRISPFVNIFGVIISGSIMEIQKIITFIDQLFQLGHNPVFHAAGGILRAESPIHIAIRAPLIEDNGVEIGPRDHNEIPFLKAHVGVEVGGEKTSRLVSLYPTYEHQGLSRFFSVNLVNVQLIGRVGEVDEVLSLGEGLRGKNTLE